MLHKNAIDSSIKIHCMPVYKPQKLHQLIKLKTNQGWMGYYYSHSGAKIKHCTYRYHKKTFPIDKHIQYTLEANIKMLSTFKSCLVAKRKVTLYRAYIYYRFQKPINMKFKQVVEGMAWNSTIPKIKTYGIGSTNHSHNNSRFTTNFYPSSVILIQLHSLFHISSTCFIYYHFHPSIIILSLAVKLNHITTLHKLENSSMHIN